MNNEIEVGRAELYFVQVPALFVLILGFNELGAHFLRPDFSLPAKWVRFKTLYIVIGATILIVSEWAWKKS